MQSQGRVQASVGASYEMAMLIFHVWAVTAAEQTLLRHEKAAGGSTISALVGSALTPSCSGRRTTAPMATTASNFPLFAMHLATTGSSNEPGTQATWQQHEQSARCHGRHSLTHDFTRRRPRCCPCPARHGLLCAAH